jgi:hypothetical protein
MTSGKSSQSRLPNGNTRRAEEGGIGGQLQVPFGGQLEHPLISTPQFETYRQPTSQDGGLAAGGECLITALDEFEARALVAEDLHAAINQFVVLRERDGSTTYISATSAPSKTAAQIPAFGTTRLLATAIAAQGK